MIRVAQTTLLAVDGGTRTSLIVGGALIVCFVLWLLHQRRVEAREAAAARVNEVDADTAPSTRFTDVAGCDEAVAELREIVQFLQHPERFTKLGAKPPRGALLVGPPGTGKTLLARAVAGEAGATFFHHAGSDFVELYVGTGAKRIRELYQKANEASPAIVFIDEIDAIGKRRTSAPASTGSNEEQEHTLIALLSELDGFTSSEVFTICATNRSDVLDPALTRPGRLERRIDVPNPDRAAREAILHVHAAGKPLAADVDLAHIASRTPGVSGATLEAILNEAALEAGRRGRDDIDQASIEIALSNIMLGRARHSALRSTRDTEITAWHEAGHAVCAKLLEGAPDPAAVSIVPRGASGGVTWMLDPEDAYLTRAAAKARLVVALGGRAAEEVLLHGEFTQGAQADLAHATELATAMVRQYGMTERGLTHRPAHMFDPYDPHTADAIEALLAEAMGEARHVLDTARATLEELAALLIERRTMNQAELDAVFGDHTPVRRRTETQARTPRSSPQVQNVVTPRRARSIRAAEAVLRVVRRERPQPRHS